MVAREHQAQGSEAKTMSRVCPPVGWSTRPCVAAPGLRGRRRSECAGQSPEEYWRGTITNGRVARQQGAIGWPGLVGSALAVAHQVGNSVLF